MKDFYDLFVKELRDIYSAEKQIAKALPDMANAATSPKLKDALRDHLAETKLQIKRLEAIAIELNEKLSGEDCEGIHVLLKEGHKILRAHYQSEVKDAAIISLGQRIEHYEIAVYGVLKTFAKHLKLTSIEELLQDSIKEEGHADKKLTEIAEGTFFTTGVNTKACRKCA